MQTTILLSKLILKKLTNGNVDENQKLICHLRTDIFTLIRSKYWQMPNQTFQTLPPCFLVAVGKINRLMQVLHFGRHDNMLLLKIIHG